jgi:hypothetical protein
VVAESGVSCPRCGSAPECARVHAWRRRRPVRDVAAGRVFTDVPILRVVLCTGATISLTPAVLWRGRSTVDSVLVAVEHVLASGLESGHDWVRSRIPGGPAVSRSTLGRWRDRVVPRASVAGLAIIGVRPADDRLHADRTEQITSLAAALSLPVLVGFRMRFGRSVLDLPPSRSASSARRSVRRTPGRLSPAPPPETGGPRLRRGTWSRAAPRGPPREVREEETTDD